MEKRFGMICFEATFVGRGLFWTCALILAFAFVVFEAINLVLALFLPNAEIKLVAASFWSIVAIVQTIGIWFWKRRRKPPDKLHLAIRPNPIHPVIKWSFPSCSNGKRGRRVEGVDQCPAVAAI